MTRFIWNFGVFFLVAAAYLLGVLEPLERTFMDLRFDVSKRDASGNIVVIEIDSRSLRELDSWPWPRHLHADLIDRLREAGAGEIAFDIDFSSRSTPEEDRKLAEALHRTHGRVILPAFRQLMRNQAGQQSIVYNQPLDIFARHSRRGLVNVGIESDGHVRRYATRHRWKGIEIDGLSANLAGEEKAAVGEFLIDYGIRAETIPRLSYVDVLRGDFDHAAVAGKAVIVGATAVELGDTFTVPVYNVIPGVMLQALAFESLVQDRALRRSPSAVTLFIALLLALLLNLRFVGWSWRKGLVVTAAAGLGAVAATTMVQGMIPVAIDVAPLVVVPLCSYGVGLWRVIDFQALAIFRHRHKSQHRRAMMQSVVDYSFEGIVITNQDGVIEMFNPAAERILGLSAEDATGTPIHSHIPTNAEIEELYADAGRREEQSPARTAVGPCEFTVESEDDEELVIELMVSSSRLSATHERGDRRSLDKTVHIYTFRNVTERKRTEQAQLKALEEFAAASRAKTEFVANMSHELRTPLNAVIGFSEIIKTELLGPVGKRQYVEYANDIYHSGTHLLEIINDILDIAKIESGEMELNESIVDISGVVTSCIRLVEERAKDKKIKIATDLPDGLPSLRGDERKIKQILSNLLSNAVKFTPDDGTVTVRCEIDGNGALVLSVNDTGIGIAAEDIEKALQKFGQVDSSLQRQYEGTGLGLPMVKALVELHGATFELESEPGAGTVVIARFPAERAAA